MTSKIDFPEIVADAVDAWKNEPNPAGDAHHYIDPLLEILTTVRIWEVVLMAEAGEVHCDCYPGCPKTTRPLYRFEYQVLATSSEGAIARAHAIFKARTSGWTLRENNHRATSCGYGHETVRARPIGQ